MKHWELWSHALGAATGATMEAICFFDGLLIAHGVLLGGGQVGNMHMSLEGV